MTVNRDYVPGPDGKFLTWVKILFASVEQNAALWKIDPATNELLSK
jgi:hypothetical protein